MARLKALGYSWAMLTRDFWYDLPTDRIAQAPVRPRDHAKLMILNCTQKSLEHRHFYDLPDYLKPGDLLVVNNTKVFRARLSATRSRRPDEIQSASPEDHDVKIEIFLLRPEGKNWLALAKPAKKLKINDQINIGPDFQGRVADKQSDGTLLIQFDLPTERVFELTDKYGQIPTPPYVEQAPADAQDYQTVYAEKTGSAAAPTAGFHFTDELITKLKNQGLKFAHVTLHVGLGTFKPVQAEKIEDHTMHAEWIEVSAETCELIEQTKKDGGRVIAVGTTSIRALEGAARANNNQLQSYQGFTNIFIKPGDAFFVIDGLVTNFHLPQSTLLMLVSAFAQIKMTEADQGRQFVLNAYQEAINNDYRFYSFGDAMLITE